MLLIKSLVRHGIGLLLTLGLPFSTLKAKPDATPQNGLLFYLSGDEGTMPDFSAAGTKEPNFLKEITLIKDGAKGVALSCGHTQLLSYWAPGNIYTQRGTLSFFWRSREPVGPTEFPLFRVGYADHSSWDMVWLRIDYNGHGFDAFVTDINLARTRVSVPLDPFPKPNEWTHITLAWDEKRGIRFYINGKLAAEKITTARYDAALDQFGPHSRIISPYQVQSDYNFARGGDIDEIRIYDRMLSDDNVATLAKGDAPTNLPPLPVRNLTDATTLAEWLFRYGWNRPDDPAPYLTGSHVGIRKVEIHDAYDLKRWWWKANDGIRETTWPGPYNRSRLPGRNDYFQLPDWDCYVESGKAITFTLPDEAWNHVEISGAPAGTMSLLKADAANDAPADAKLFDRPAGQEKTVHTIATSLVGGKIRFNNIEQEDPIGELSVYNVTTATEPTGSARLVYRLVQTKPVGKSLAPLLEYISGRYAPDERAMLVAQPIDSKTPAVLPTPNALPLVHVLIPCDGGKGYQLDSVDGGLDGIALDLPALKVAPEQNGLVELNIQVKDPLWPLRNMFDFTFSVKPGEAKTLWLDLRDRILPPGKALYLTVASASSDFSAATLAGSELRLVFKPKDAARAEHELDRFTQARDSYAMLVEEHANSPKFNLWNRFLGDITDLIRINPNHIPGKNYFAFAVATKMPDYKHPEPPTGVPLWAFRQVELLKRVDFFVNWWIENRQIAYGDFGGGISDDVDLTNTWPGVALMGYEPDKLKTSVHALLEAAYKNGMFTNGLPTIQADYLHSYEEGINCLGQNMILDFGNPKQIERAMETARGVNGITGINAAGHRHIRTMYYSGTKMAVDSVWGSSRGYSYLVLQPGQLLVEYNGNPEEKKIVTELADGLLAHRKKDGNGEYALPSSIQFATDKADVATRTYFPWPLFWTAYKWTGDQKYVGPILDGGTFNLTGVNANSLDLLNLRKEWGPKFVAKASASASYRSPEIRGSTEQHFAWQVTGDKKYLSDLYAGQIEFCDLIEYINTDGSLWSDRVGVPYIDLQRARLGGVALVRNGTFPGHVVSWRFAAPATDKSLAILLPFSTPTHFTVVAFNLDEKPVQAVMTGWNIDPGVWEITQGIDTNNDDKADRDIATSSLAFERSRSVELTFPPRATTVLNFTLKQPGTPYWQRPDLGLTSEDVQVNGNTVQVRVHSLGAVASPAVTVAFRDRSGQIIAKGQLAPIAAPVDLFPKTAEVSLALPEGSSAAGGSVEIDPDHAVEEITRLNNIAKL